MSRFQTGWRDFHLGITVGGYELRKRIQEENMNGSRVLGVSLLATVALAFATLARVSSAQQTAIEETISGTISATRTIMQNARLTGNVTCTVNAAPCLRFGAPGLTLNLNGFTITGQGDPSTGCQSTRVVNEDGIVVNNQQDEAIQGPGLVQGFRADGILLLNSARNLVTRVTTSTNCMSGILVSGSSDNHIEGVVSVRNGTTAAPCGGL